MLAAVVRGDPAEVRSYVQGDPPLCDVNDAEMVRLLRVAACNTIHPVLLLLARALPACSLSGGRVSTETPR
jgi:hypothetical protein